MDAAFWIERWEKDETGWHEGHPNPYLVRYWPKLGLHPGATVLVPLCGKSVDLLWLRDHGVRAVGVELSGIAVREFAAESGLALTAEDCGKLTRYRNRGLELWAGDIFDLAPEQLPLIDAVFDRAALMALPSGMRGRYARQLLRLAPQAGQMLIVVTFSPEATDERPPFSVDAGELREHFGRAYTMEALETNEILADFPALRRRGFSRLAETAYHLRRRATPTPARSARSSSFCA